MLPGERAKAAFVFRGQERGSGGLMHRKNEALLPRETLSVLHIWFQYQCAALLLFVASVRGL